MTPPYWAPPPPPGGHIGYPPVAARPGLSFPPAAAGPVGLLPPPGTGYPPPPFPGAGPVRPPLSTWEGRGTFASQLGPDAELPDRWALTPTPSRVVPLRPLLFGDIVSGTFRAVRFNAASTMGVTLILVLGVQLVVALVTLGVAALGGADTALPMTGDLTNFLDSTQFALSLGDFVAAGGISAFLATAALSYTVCEGVVGRRVTPVDVFRRLGRRLGALILFSLLALTAVAVAVLAWMFVGGALSSIDRSWEWLPFYIVGSVVGLLAAGAALATKLSFVLPVICVESAGPLAAIRRSWRLTQGRFWRVFAITLFTGFIVQLAAGTVAQLLSVVSLVINLDNPVTLMIGLLASSLLGSILATPLRAGVTALLYVDARMRDEGLDIELAWSAVR